MDLYYANAYMKERQADAELNRLRKQAKQIRLDNRSKTRPRFLLDAARQHLTAKAEQPTAKPTVGQNTPLSQLTTHKRQEVQTWKQAALPFRRRIRRLG